MESIEIIKQQVYHSDYSQLDDLISQIQIYTSNDSTQVTTEGAMVFPRLTQEILICFFESVDVESLRATGSFEKKYAVGAAPEGNETDSEACPDLLILSVENSSREFSLLLRNSFFVNEAIGCSASATIHLFKVENGALRLKKVDFAR